MKVHNCINFEDKENEEKYSIVSDTLVETMKNSSIISVIDLMTQDLIEFADVGDASEMSEIEKTESVTGQSVTDTNNNKEIAKVEEREEFTTQKAAQKLWDLLKILHDKVNGKIKICMQNSE